MKLCIATGSSGLSVVFLGSWQRTEQAIQQLLHNFRGPKPPQQTTFTNLSLQRVVGRRVVSSHCQQILRNSRGSVRAVPTFLSSLTAYRGQKEKASKTEKGLRITNMFLCGLMVNQLAYPTSCYWATCCPSTKFTQGTEPEMVRHSSFLLWNNQA